MNIYDWTQIFVCFFLLAITIPVLGSFISKIFGGQSSICHPMLNNIEKSLYAIADVNPNIEMTWIIYAKKLLAFNSIGLAALFFITILQGYLPLNPQHLAAPSLDQAFNIASSFTTNTNWQSYTPETTLSYFTQMVGLGVQNFLSAATGLAVMIALIRGLTRKCSETIGNFWVDLVRSILYLLLPLSFLFAILLIGQGSVQTFDPYILVDTLEGGTQTIPLGPVASQEAIKQLGSNGGGYFNANSAHPFENPTPLSNFLETFALLLIPAASIYAYGIMINSRKHAVLLLAVVSVMFFGSLLVAQLIEHNPNPIMGAYPLLEGKETRFDTDDSIVWAISTTATSNGSVNASMSSLKPLSGGIALFNIMLGEIIFGGVGVGLCGIIMFIILTIFLCGLMVGRTPEYLGKKIDKREMQWVVVAILTPAALILLGSGISCILPYALTSLSHSGPHGLTEIIYAFASAAGNNGSAFAGLNADTPYYNISLGVTMLLGRLAILIPSLGLAGLLAKKNITPPTIGTLSTNSFIFSVLLIGVILIVGALTFFPALSLGPIVEHILMLKGKTF